ncbi:MAG TPA: flagellar motor protein [Pseudomonadales bacterium]|nr:flagellar motor protein [Pseudomonadales bacterium]
MDILTIVGILLGLLAILLGNYLDGGHISSLLNFPALLIVLGGTLGAVCVQTPLPVVKRTIKLSSWILFPPVLQLEKDITRIVSWSVTARQEGLLGLEKMIEKEKNSFCQKGLQLLVDGSEPEALRTLLENDIHLMEVRNMDAAKVFESMGGYSPTIGIIGAVLGLIHVMNNLADPAMLGAGIATAFVATIYGVGAANLLFLPWAVKIKATTKSQIQYYEMIMEGLCAISEGENPRSIELRLRSYLTL